MSTKRLTLLFVKGMVKGMFTERDLQNYCGRTWWDRTRTIEVPLRDYEIGRVNVTNVQNYIVNRVTKR